MTLVFLWSPISTTILVIQKIHDTQRNRLASNLASPIRLVPHDHPFPSYLEVWNSTCTTCLLSLPGWKSNTHLVTISTSGSPPVYVISTRLSNTFLVMNYTIDKDPGLQIPGLHLPLPIHVSRQSFTAPNIVCGLAMKIGGKSCPSFHFQSISGLTQKINLKIINQIILILILIHAESSTCGTMV